MAQVVPIKRKCYPIVLRAVLDKKLWYRAALIEGTTAEITFSAKSLKDLFRINDKYDWCNEAAFDLLEAYDELRELVRLSKCDVEPDGFFITIRPDNAIEPLAVVALGTNWTKQLRFSRTR